MLDTCLNILIIILLITVVLKLSNKYFSETFANKINKRKKSKKGSKKGSKKSKSAKSSKKAPQEKVLNDTYVDDTMTLNGKLQFNDPNSLDNKYYHLEKITHEKNKNSLRLSINNKVDDSFEIWGNGCVIGDCAGPGEKAHSFDARGKATHKKLCLKRKDGSYSCINTAVFNKIIQG